MFVGSRDGQRVILPRRTHAERLEQGRLPWATLRSALETLEDPEPEFTEIAPGKRRFMTMVPEGGNWRDLPVELQPEALGSAYVSWGGRTGFYRRLAWDAPTPALTTRPDSKATMLCHPTDLRPLTGASMPAFSSSPTTGGSRAVRLRSTSRSATLYRSAWGA